MIAIEPAHAVLSASGSKKWLTCTPSARLEQQFPDERSAFAAEGTFMHTLFELRVNLYLARLTEADYLQQMAQHRANPFFSTELDEAVDTAVEVACHAIEEVFATCPDARVLVEQRADFSRWVPQGFGTADLVIVGDDLLWVMDLKGGKGVMVDALDNSQLRLYAIGTLSRWEHLYDIKRVRSSILQPRLDNWSTEELGVEELLRWADDFVKPRATLAWDGLGEFVAGSHCHAGFCRARFTCSARAEANLAVARSEFALKPPELMTDEQIVSVLAKADQAIKWLQDVQAYALQQATQGNAPPGFKLVEGKANRKFSDPEAVAKRLVDAGVAESDVYERSVKGITALEKALGKKRFAELAGDLVVKPAGKATLVPDADPRPVLTSSASAEDDFTKEA